MRTKFLTLLIAAFVYAHFVIPASALTCSGDACGAVTVSKKNGCIVFINKGDRRIQVNVGPNVYVLYAFSEEVAALSNVPCYTSILGYGARYI